MNGPSVGPHRMAWAGGDVAIKTAESALTDLEKILARMTTLPTGSFASIIALMANDVSCVGGPLHRDLECGTSMAPRPMATLKRRSEAVRGGFWTDVANHHLLAPSASWCTFVTEVTHAAFKIPRFGAALLAKPSMILTHLSVFHAGICVIFPAFGTFLDLTTIRRASDKFILAPLEPAAPTGFKRRLDITAIHTAIRGANFR